MKYTRLQILPSGPSKHFSLARMKGTVWLPVECSVVKQLVEQGKTKFLINYTALGFLWVCIRLTDNAFVGVTDP